MSTRDPILDIFYARITYFFFFFHSFSFFSFFLYGATHTWQYHPFLKKFLFDFTYDLYLQQYIEEMAFQGDRPTYWLNWRTRIIRNFYSFPFEKKKKTRLERTCSVAINMKDKNSKRQSSPKIQIGARKLISTKNDTTLIQLKISIH